MKKTTILFVSIFLSVFGFSQDELFGNDVINISAGIGFPNTTHAALDAGNQLFNLNGKDNGSSTPFYNVSGTYGISENVGVGVYLGYFSSDSEILATGNTLISALRLLGANINTNQSFGSTRYNVFTVGGRLMVHKPIIDNPKFDTYASTYLGYNFVNDSIDDVEFITGQSEFDVPILGTIDINNLLRTAVSEANYPTFTYDVNAGLKYKVGENISLFGEAGYGRFLVNTGLTYTMP